MSKHPKYNTDLWFEHKGCTGKHFILGNPHTFIGRIYAWCPVKQTAFCVSRTEIGKLSNEAEYWIKGYLTGQQPVPPTNENDEIDYQSKEFKEWEKKVDIYEKTGDWK